MKQKETHGILVRRSQLKKSFVGVYRGTEEHVRCGEAARKGCGTRGKETLKFLFLQDFGLLGLLLGHYNLS
ncbi:hypothetical protein ES332_A01G131800v1 [Gossypium tomentosum]|uniref:Uncharacterized protein n=1 Tax=Gossypium tomentosum TaxID=34277 RepID=A0A5D2RQ32_GOSTO|nr:hypothetical protein ES332_A01G131800v1 [Gossypium tomentosum]